MSVDRSQELPLRPGPKRRGCLVAGIIAVSLFAAVVYHRYDPSASRLFPPCLLQQVTGLYCPGCGSQRAVHRLLHGDVAGALRFNPLLVAVLPLIMYESLRALWSGRRPAGLPSVMDKPLAVWVLLIVILAFGVCRNVPVFPFSTLAPHG